MKRLLEAIPVTVTGMGWRKLLVFTALFVLLSVGTPWVIHARLDLPSLPSTVWRDGLTALLAGAALLPLFFAADALRLHYTLAALGRPVPGRDLGKLVFINQLFSSITPLATGGGVAQVWYLRGRGLTVGAAIAATTVRTFLAMLLIFLPTPFLVLGLEALPDRVGGQSVSAILATVALAYLSVFALALRFRRTLMKWLDTLLRGLRFCRLIGDGRFHRWRRHGWREMCRFGHALKAYVRGPRKAIFLSVLSTLVFLLTLFSFPAVMLWGLGYGVDYPLTVALANVTTFIMYFAPTPGASGVAEGAFGHLFGGLISPGHLVLVMVAWRFFTLYLGMLLGVPATLHEVARRGNGHGQT